MHKISLDSKILVAGAFGMAGKAICKKLQHFGYSNIYKPTKEDLNYLNFNDTARWFEIKKPDVVIMAAAKVGGIMANSSKSADFILENIKIQTNLIETAWRNGVKKLIFLGSSCIYPKKSEQPIKEEYLLSGSLEDTNKSYAIAKISGIQLCNSLREQYGFNAISLMPTNLYGPGDNYDEHNSHVMAALIKRFLRAKKLNLSSVTCWGTGSPLREFLHVDDLGEAVVFTLNNWDPSSPNSPKDQFGNPILHLNIGTGKDISIKDLSIKISKIVGFEGQIKWDHSKPDGTSRKLLDVKRINKLGWEASIALEDGISQTISNLKDQDLDL